MSASHCLARGGACCSLLGGHLSSAFVRRGVPEERQSHLPEAREEGTGF